MEAYLRTSLAARWAERAAKPRGGVVVAEPGVAISETFEKTSARRGSVGPISMRKATTAISLAG